MIRVSAEREPTHPGEILVEELLGSLGIIQRQLADAIHIPCQRVNEIVNRRRGVAPSTARRLEKVFGMSAGFWLKLQYRWDLYHTQQDEGGDLKSIKPPLSHVALQKSCRNRAAWRTIQLRFCLLAKDL